MSAFGNEKMNEQFERLTDLDIIYQAALAERPDTSKDLIVMLSALSSPTVKASVAKNHTAPANTLAKLVYET